MGLIYTCTQPPRVRLQRAAWPTGGDGDAAPPAVWGPGQVRGTRRRVSLPAAAVGLARVKRNRKTSGSSTPLHQREREEGKPSSASPAARRKQKPSRCLVP